MGERDPCPVCGLHAYECDDACWDDAEDDWNEGDECGRWDQRAPNGMQPVYYCRLAGTEFCDFMCPYRDD